MAHLFEKIALGILFVVLVGFNSFFILGQRDDVAPVATSSLSVGKMNSYIPVVRDADEEEIEDDDEDISLEELKTITGRLTEEQAKKIALATIGGGTVIDFEAEREHGRLVYGVTIRAQGDTVEVEVDGQTGEVLEIEWGEDDDGDDD